MIPARVALPTILVLAALGAAEEAPRPERPARRRTWGPQLLLTAETMPAVDRITASDVRADLLADTITPGVGITWADTESAFVGFERSIDHYDGGGVRAQISVRTPGPFGVCLRVGPFCRFHGGSIEEEILLGSALSWWSSTAPAGGTAGPASPLLPAGSWLVETRGYWALGLGLTTLLSLDVGPVRIEAGPFLDLGFGAGGDPEVRSWTALSVPYSQGVLEDVDEEVDAGGYWAAGGTLDVLVHLAHGLRVGGGIFVLYGEGRDELDVYAETRTVVPGPLTLLGYQAHRFVYDREYRFEGVGLKLLVGATF